MSTHILNIIDKALDYVESYSDYVKFNKLEIVDQKDFDKLKDSFISSFNSKIIAWKSKLLEERVTYNEHTKKYEKWSKKEMQRQIYDTGVIVVNEDENKLEEFSQEANIVINRYSTFIHAFEKHSLFERGRLYDLLIFYQKDGEIMTSFYHYETWPGVFEKKYKTYHWEEHTFEKFMGRYYLDQPVQSLY